jgi:uncharacterized protein (DUF1800 family)
MRANFFRIRYTKRRCPPLGYCRQTHIMLPSIARTDWDTAKAAHLLSRAGYGATPDEIRRAASRDPRDVVEELVEYQHIPEDFERPAWAVTADADLRPNRAEMRALTEEERQQQLRAMREAAMGQMIELRAWWLYRMRYTKRPLQEKLTLFWHGHFATSMEKVRSPYCMYRQNETLRAHASGNWSELIEAVAKDPAMLIYLDNAQSRARHPNENFARELMELFTLGEGQYTEDDIKESARAFTGWTLDRDRFRFVRLSRQHDDGAKVFFGRRGTFDGGDIVKILVEQPAGLAFIARKLWTFFAYEDPEPEAVQDLADALRTSHHEWKPVLKRMFLSRAFYGTRAIRSQVKSPVQWLVGSARMLEAPLPSADVCQMILRQLGQDLFAPPNVKGWDGGYAWITTNTLMHRYNFAGLLVKGGDGLGLDAARMERRSAAGGGPGQRGMLAAARSNGIIDPRRILPDEARSSKAAAQQHLETRLFHGPLRDQAPEALREYFARLPEPSEWADEDVRNVVHVMMSTPHYQLT